MTALNFDATQVAPQEGFEALPAGWYQAMVTGTEMKPTKDNTGQRLNIEYTLIGGQYANRKIFAGLNLVNSNPEAQKIAYTQLSALCHATGQLRLQDTQQLHGIPLDIKLKLRAADGTYEASNDVSQWRALTEGGVQTAGVAPTMAAPVAPIAPVAPVAPVMAAPVAPVMQVPVAPVAPIVAAPVIAAPVIAAPVVAVAATAPELFTMPDGSVAQRMPDGTFVTVTAAPAAPVAAVAAPEGLAVPPWAQ